MDNQKIMEQVVFLLEQVQKELSFYKDYVSDKLKEILHAIQIILENADMETKRTVMQELRKILTEGDTYVNIYVYSFMIEITHEEKDLTDVYKIIEHSDKLSIYTKYYLYYQLKIKMFTFAELDKENARVAKWQLFQHIFYEFKKIVSAPLDYIPEESRNEQLVVIITEQMLSDKVGPTRTALERSASVIRDWKKKVLLINTAEAATSVGKIDVYNNKIPNYIKEWNELAFMEWKGVKIPFVQCDQNMPDKEMLDMLLLQIRKLAPGYVLNLGGSSLFANLVNEFLPVLTIGLGFSELEPTQTMFQTLARKIKDDDRKLVRILGMPENHVIETRFTFDIKPAFSSFTRKEVGIPENKFILAVVGTRLDNEITEEFLELLDKLCGLEEYFVVFAGVYNTYQQKINTYEHLVQYSLYCGYQNDMLAFFSLCDLFVNPIRKGGGTMAVEAMSQGIPVVSTPYGDIAADIGEEFQVEDYRIMLEEIQHYCHNKEYYAEKSELARKIAGELTEEKAWFIDLLEEYSDRMHRFDKNLRDSERKAAYCVEWVNQALQLCAYMEQNDKSMVANKFKELADRFVLFDESDKKKIFALIESSQPNDNIIIFVYSCILYYTKVRDFEKPVMSHVLSCDYEVLQGCMMELQVMGNIKGCYKEKRALHRKNAEKFREVLGKERTYIPPEERNKRKIVLVTEQIGKTLHAPTTIVLNIASILIKYLQYDVFLFICPCNYLTESEEWYRSIVINSISGVQGREIDLEYKDVVIPAYQISMQSENCMEEYRMMMAKIQKWKPVVVLGLGIVNPILDLINDITTVAAMTMSISCPVSDAEILFRLGKNEETLEEEYISSFNENQSQIFMEESIPVVVEGQKGTLCSRGELGLPQDKFIIAVVGNRLDQEIDLQFVSLMKDILEENPDSIFVVIGNVSSLKEKFAEKEYSEKVYYLGFVQDLPGTYGVVDLYLNPKRTGGGWSGAMALMAGVPVVTLPDCDVAKNVGENFVVSDYPAMKETVSRYITDKLFSETMIKYAAEKASCNTEENMIQYVMKMMDSINAIMEER